MRKIPALGLAALLPLVAYAAVNWGRLLDQNGGSRVHFGAQIEGREPFSRNSEESFAPASTMKMITAGLVLSRLGADFRFITTASWEQSGERASQLQIRGSGDPTWGLPQFREGPRSRLDQIAKALAESGVREIAGEPLFLSNDPRWNLVSVPEGWKESDTLSCMGAMAQGFNIGMNCASYQVRGVSSGSWANSLVRAPVEVRLEPGSRTSITWQLNRYRGTLRFVATGTWRAGDSPKSFTLPVYETNSWAAGLFRQALQAQGIRLVSARDGVHRGERRSQSFASPPLSEILKPFLKNSVNFLGDALLKASVTEPGPANTSLLEPGLANVQDYLLSLGLPREFSLHDGAGLSRTSRATPRFMLEFLQRLTREPYFPALWEALAVAGVDGTLRNRMKGTDAAGKLRGKTGTLDGVYNLAGYVPHGREMVPFVILSRSAGLAGQARSAEDRVGASLARIHSSGQPLGFMEENLPEPYPYFPEQAGMDDQ